MTPKERLATYEIMACASDDNVTIPRDIALALIENATTFATIMGIYDRLKECG